MYLSTYTYHARKETISSQQRMTVKLVDRCHSPPQSWSDNDQQCHLCASEMPHLDRTKIQCRIRIPEGEIMS